MNPRARPLQTPIVSAILDRAKALREPLDLSPLVEELARCRIVMLGESSHGTQEYYEWRRILSQWLIVKHGFRFIAVEGDWPPAWELNRFVNGEGPERAEDALHSFHRWPTWMWANSEVARLAQWMRSHNERMSVGEKAGFYGLDVYSLFESMGAVVQQLDTINPFLGRRARMRYGCFDPYRADEVAYARSLLTFPEGCQQQVAKTLEDLLKLRLDDGRDRELALFDARQNARVVANAEQYYRTMIHADDESWNVRDRHMLETLEQLLERFGPDSKAIVWAHNTHIGDYRATDMARQGQINLGGLAREKWGDDNVALVGFGTYEGEVVASHAWDGPIEICRVPPGQKGSLEADLHEASLELREPNYFFSLRDPSARSGPLRLTRGHRAIGVVYQPQFERFGNYVPTSLAARYDAFLFFDRTTALHPLAQAFDRREIPDTWPRGQ